MTETHTRQQENSEMKASRHLLKTKSTTDIKFSQKPRFLCVLCEEVVEGNNS